jgi:predicted neutral ceramidase superfamily lipid hydrolase
MRAGSASVSKKIRSTKPAVKVNSKCGQEPGPWPRRRRELRYFEPMKQSPVVRLLRWARAVVSDDAQVRQDVMRGNMRRLRWLIPMFLAFDLLMWAVFSLADPPLSPMQYEWSRAVIQVYVGTSVWLVLVWLFFMTVVQRTQFGRAARLLQAVAPLTLLVFTAVLAALDQKITPSITPYLLGCLSVSLLFLLPPVVAIGLAASGYAVLFVGIGLTQPDPALLLTNRGNGLAVALLSLVLSLVLWRRNTQYLLLQRELSERNRALERQ